MEVLIKVRDSDCEDTKDRLVAIRHLFEIAENSLQLDIAGDIEDLQAQLNISEGH